MSFTDSVKNDGKNSSLSMVFLVIATLVFTCGLILLFHSPARAVDAAEQQGLVDKARVTFQNFMNDQDMIWLKENMPHAKGVLIIPSLLKGGFFIGGSGGSGVLIVRDEKTGKWSQPGFYTIGSVTFGLQIGGEAAEVLMMVRSKKGIDSLLTTSFKLGGDTSVAAGPIGAGAKSSVTADIVSFARSKGAFLGASLEGAVIKTKDKWNEAYYKEGVRPTDIFVLHSVSNPGSVELREQVAKAAKKK
jgi:lipid-binding SYLF domain-containing protein